MLAAADHGEACRIGRRLAGRGLSLQSWHILPKVRQVDGLLRRQPWLLPRFQEVHPELAFLDWNGGCPLPHGKRSREGRAERLALCEELFPGVWASLCPRFRRREVADDDILDALALLRSAARLGRGGDSAAGAAVMGPLRPADAHRLVELPQRRQDRRAPLL